MQTGIIGCRPSKPSCPVTSEDEILAVHLEWGFFHVCVLQCAARFFSGADAALLAAANDASRQVSGRVAPEVRHRSGCSRWLRRETGNLGARGFGGRGCGVERSRHGIATEISVPS